jgi:hypothetical protein
MPPQINLNDLYSIQKKKAQNRTVCFDKILQLCHNRIKTIASFNGQNTFFEVPGFMIGFPLYNLNEALDYIVNALRKNGFLVQLLPEPHIAVIYISWDPEELKPPKPIKQIRPREEIAYKQKLLGTERSKSIYEKSFDSFKNSIDYNKQNTYIMPLPETIIPSADGIPLTQNTRPQKHEPFYLANLRIF